jgi:hypothetical protein
LRVDLTIEEMEIGAVDERDGRVSEIGVNSLVNRIRSWSKLKRYQLTRGRRLAGERFSSAPPTFRAGAGFCPEPVSPKSEEYLPMAYLTILNYYNCIILSYVTQYYVIIELRPPLSCPFGTIDIIIT